MYTTAEPSSDRWLDPGAFGPDRPTGLMVDFQSRETRRGLGDDDEEDETDEEESVPEDAAQAEPTTDEEPEPDASDEEDLIAVLATGDANTTAREAAVGELESAGYAVLDSDQRARDHDRIQSAVDDFVDRPEVVAVVTVGGTGVAPEDSTVEAVGGLFSRDLPGFGEAFRREWADATGDAAIGSRVTAGLVDGTPVFCLPDEPTAATLAAGDLVAPDAAAIHHMASGN